MSNICLDNWKNIKKLLVNRFNKWFESLKKVEPTKDELNKVSWSAAYLNQFDGTFNGQKYYYIAKNNFDILEVRKKNLKVIFSISVGNGHETIAKIIEEHNTREKDKVSRMWRRKT